MDRSTRDQILDAAADLFARRGFKATTVAQIEEAAGLSPGSGGLYRHFRSKQAVLEEAIRRAELNQVKPTFDDQRLFDFDHPDAALRAIAEMSLAGARRDAALYAVLRQPRDDLSLDAETEGAVERLVSQGVVRLAWWMELMARAGRFRAVDFPAVAAHAVMALSWFHVTHDYLGIPPGGVEEERFLDAWVDIYRTYLAGPDEGAVTPGTSAHP